MEQLSLDRINQIDLVDYLATLGIQPIKRKAHSYYYCSPLPNHPTSRPTFIVNRRLNRWRETTTRQTGRLADLVVTLYDCTIGELTARLQAALPLVSHPHSGKCSNHRPAISIEQTNPIRSAYLERFLWERRIPQNVSHRFCFEAWYTREKSLYHALAFRNDAGGFELFDRYRQYRVPASGPTLIVHHSKKIAVFRHVLDMMTFAAIFPGPEEEYPNFLVLNAPVPFQAIRQIIEPYHTAHLFLPNDPAAIVFSNQASSILPRCTDHRPLYAGYPSLNAWICRIGTAQGSPYSP
ncbi:MAG TPA: hypothetical protein VFE32_21520 [Puia sp.]|jgi:hypothetical protein|nr:hypothetical protein [Puia sp.]